MNSALVRGALELRSPGFTTVGIRQDLPALRPESAATNLTASRLHRRSFIADASGVGTTILVAHDVELFPHFGVGRLPLTTPLAQ